VSTPLISQDVVPIGSGYVILMAVLAAGLRLQRRERPDRPTRPGAGAGTSAGAGASTEAGARAEAGASGEAGEGSGGRQPGLAARLVGPGWPRFAVQVGSVAVGGYVLLMAVIVLYYYGVARVAGNFLVSAVTGCAMLIGLSALVFAAASWLAERRARRSPGRQRNM
jgi:Family of unknown function (DUF6256)